MYQVILNHSVGLLTISGSASPDRISGNQMLVLNLLRSCGYWEYRCTLPHLTLFF